MSILLQGTRWSGFGLTDKSTYEKKGEKKKVIHYSEHVQRDVEKCKLWQ